MAVIPLPGTGTTPPELHVGDVVVVPSSPSNVVLQPEATLDIQSSTVTIKNNISEMDDVDVSVGLENNSLLMYNAPLNKWKPTKKLEDHYMNAGHF